jgi:thiol-disulfide isomerase/thioredoxin
MKVGMNFVFVLIGLSAAATGMSAQQYHGTLSSELMLQHRFGHTKLKPAVKIPANLGITPGDKVYSGSFSLSFENEAKTRIRVLVVTPSANAPYLFVDSKREGGFGQDARVALAPVPQENENDSAPPDESGYSGETSLAWPIGMFKTYPIKLTVWLPNPSAKQPKQNTSRKPSKIGLDFSTSVSVNGTLDIDGKSVKVSYTLDPAGRRVNPYREQLGVDCNMDGKLDQSYTSPEQADGNGGPVIFRVGTHYIATTAVDVATGAITAEEKPAAEYRRIELVEGSKFPDFSFRDMDGNRHNTTELRGKYVVLDTWGTWCGGCLEAMKDMKEMIYPRFHSKGLEILSLDMEHPGGRELPKPDLLAKGKKQAAEYLHRKQIPWLQADEESVYDLVENRMMVQRFPTVIVLDPEGKILGIDWTTKEMESKFAKLLPEGAPPGF